MSIKIVIIIPNESKISLPIYVAQCEQFHKEKLEKFIWETGIEIPNDQLQNSQKISWSLAEQGFCVILYDQIEDYKNLLIFLPLQISDNQMNWFQKRIEEFKQYDIAIFNHSSLQKWEQIDCTTIKQPILFTLKELLEEKYVPQGKIKQKTPKNQ